MGSYYKVQTLVGDGAWDDWKRPTKDLPQGTIVRILENDGNGNFVPGHDHLGHTVGMILKVIPDRIANEEFKIALGYEAICTLRLSLPDIPTVEDLAWLKENAAGLDQEFDRMWTNPPIKSWYIPWRNNNPKINVSHTFLTIWTEHDRKEATP